MQCAGSLGWVGSLGQRICEHAEHMRHTADTGTRRGMCTAAAAAAAPPYVCIFALLCCPSVAASRAVHNNRARNVFAIQYTATMQTRTRAGSLLRRTAHNILYTIY